MTCWRRVSIAAQNGICAFAIKNVEEGALSKAGSWESRNEKRHDLPTPSERFAIASVSRANA